MVDPIPSLLPTTVIGSHAYPGWMWTALDEVEKGNYGRTDERELYDDAVNMAMLDQEKAGIDIISDGEMRRWYFVQSFYKKIQGIEQEPELRKVGLYGYDSPPRYKAVEKLVVPNGLGIVDEYKYARANTTKPIKVTCPGPLTVTIHVRPGEVYKDRIEMSWDFAKVINKELKELVDLGVEYIQLDEPSFAVIPGQLDDWVDLYNASVEGVDAKIGLHICFGNLTSRPRGKRSYGWMFPKVQECRYDELILEYSNREMSEIEHWHDWAGDKQLGLGAIDVKSFYVEKPEDVAERIRLAMQYGPAEQIVVNPDCGFFQLPRWITRLKLDAMVAGTAIVRNELSG
jgi:5-methyltetrahydropteroyltriglutamate--homocysteine methyltransferase